jgi:hypothetical protein
MPVTIPNPKFDWLYIKLVENRVDERSEANLVVDERGEVKLVGSELHHEEFVPVLAR